MTVSSTHTRGDGVVFAAVDLGASSGRVMAGVVTGTVTTGVGVELVEIHRFSNGARDVDGSLCWDFETIWTEVITGLRALCARFDNVVSIGVDTWAVDYGLLDDHGRLLGDPYAYRDARTTPVVDQVHAKIDFAELYAVCGLQFLPFNTVYQVAAEQAGPRWARADTLLLLPDLIGERLTGVRAAEITNASTTGLLDASTRTWSEHVLNRLGLDAALLPELVEPGTVLGPVLPEHGLPGGLVVTTVGSHDTASAVVAVPATNPRFAYVSSGTWSLVGLELAAPSLTAACRDANFTNEGGVDHTIRFLRNLGGLWLLEQCRETWRAEGDDRSLAELLAAAAELPTGGPVVDVDGAELIEPGNMPARIRAAGERAGSEPLDGAAGLTRCILDSLAQAYARTIDQASELTGQAVEVVHIVGGGSQNELLCRLTADACRREVIAGPVEATALGNVLVQARTHDALGPGGSASLAELRRALAGSVPLKHYLPH